MGFTLNGAPASEATKAEMLADFGLTDAAAQVALARAYANASDDSPIEGAPDPTDRGAAYYLGLAQGLVAEYIGIPQAVRDTLDALLPDDLPVTPDVQEQLGGTSKVSTTRVRASELAVKYDGHLTFRFKGPPAAAGDYRFYLGPLATTNTATFLDTAVTTLSLVPDADGWMEVYSADMGAGVPKAGDLIWIEQVSVGDGYYYQASGPHDSYNFTPGDQSDGTAALTPNVGTSLTVQLIQDVPGGIDDTVQSRIDALAGILGAGGLSGGETSGGGSPGGGGSGTATVLSDGTALQYYRAKRANLLANPEPAAVTVKHRLILWLHGDSWTHRPYFANMMIDRLKAAGLPHVATGWISMAPYQGGGYPLYRNEGWTQTGFTLNDASGTSALPVKGTDSIDGQTLSATGTSAVAALTFYGTHLYLHYKDLNGTFRYRVNGGSWTTVACGNTGDNLRVLATDQGDPDVQGTVEIDLIGNAGTVQFNGAMATSPGVAGFEFNRAGNGGVQMWELAACSAARRRELALYGADVFILMDGTNDQRKNEALADFEAAASTILDDVEAVTVGQGIVCCPPANGNVPQGLTPMTEYGATLASVIADRTGWEIARFDLLWADYATESALGMWNDTLHLSQPEDDLGGYIRAASELHRAFLSWPD